MVFIPKAYNIKLEMMETNIDNERPSNKYTLHRNQIVYQVSKTTETALYNLVRHTH